MLPQAQPEAIARVGEHAVPYEAVKPKALHVQYVNGRQSPHFAAAQLVHVPQHAVGPHWPGIDGRQRDQLKRLAAVATRDVGVTVEVASTRYCGTISMLSEIAVVPGVISDAKLNV